MTIPVAFYAPLKSPDDPTPSGDRTVARLLLRALERAGLAPRIASRLRSFDPRGDAHPEIARRAEAEADALAEALAPAPPALWFTYHLYYKAPDWIGPRVAARLRIPYVVAEGSRAAKRAHGPHAFGHAAAEAALDAADAVLCLTARDRVALERVRPAGQRLVDLPPFLELDAWPRVPRGREPRGGPSLLAVGMMRPGDKLASHALLAEAFGRLAAPETRLTLVGDGPARREVETLFARFGERVRFAGLVTERAALAQFCADADLLVWPAVNEAYGMALLEAQAQGCPVVAGNYGGVAAVVRHGETGLLTPPGDAAALAAALDALLADAPRRAAMGLRAEDFARGERGLDGAATILRGLVGDLIGGRAAA